MSDDRYELDVEYDDLEEMAEPECFRDATLFAQEVPDLDAFDVGDALGGIDTLDGYGEPDGEPATVLGSPLGAEMPPERVRFAAPLILREEGRRTEDEDEEFEGAVVNLSTSGIAILSPLELIAGQRVWASFRLSLGEAPLTFLCEVIWRRPPRDGLFACGLAFRSMTDEEAERVVETVRERAEGRAGEWPLPMMPEESPPPPRSANPWVTAAAGMVAGIALAVVVSAIPRSATTAPLPEIVPAAVAAGAAPGPGEDVGIQVARQDHQVPVADPAPTAIPTKLGAAPAEEPTAEPAAEPNAAPAAVAEPEKVADTRLPRITERPAPASNVDYLRPSGSDTEMAVALLADGPVAGHSSFWLADPRRLVIDVPARKSGFARHTYGIEHPLASRLRVGNHPDKVRYVIETAADVAADVDTRAQGSALVVTLHR